MTSADEFVMVEGRVEIIREGSISFSLPLEPANWIPRSLLHHEDRAAVDQMMAGTVTRLRIRRWKAQQLGIVGDRDQNTEDLFGNGRPVI